MNVQNVDYKKPIRSYVRREGRMTPRQRQALQVYWPQYGLEMSETIFNFSEIFQREAPVVLEIGFGMGQSLLAMAKAAPELNFVGVEVHRPGIGALLAELAEQSIANVRIVNADAKEVLQQCVADNGLDKVQIFFPDPWPKKRHHKRRLIQVEFVELLQAKLKLGGCLHLATDWEDYAQQMLLILSNCRLSQVIENILAEKIAARPATKYQQRGIRFQHAIFELVFAKHSETA